MGVTTLWLMPIYPISFRKRKGTLGSYYAIADYTKINPEFGTFEDFKDLVGKIHEMQMRILLDWVPNHTGWDHHWITSHPEWYTQVADTISHGLNNDGTPTDWYDVADLNYENESMQNTMIESMKFWLRAADVDGFRCDMAHLVPVDFWKKARPALEQIKPLFMIAEAEGEPLHFESSFQANYGWTLHHMLNDIAKGNKNASDLEHYVKESRAKYPSGAYSMNFTSNHDENSWAGSAPDRLGDALEAMTVLTFTMEGIPLVYSGQEAANTKELAFFEKDEITWDKLTLEDFYAKLLHFKNYNKALWNGINGGQLVRINAGEDIFAFKREKDGHRVFVLINCTGKKAITSITEDIFAMTDLFSGAELSFRKGDQITMDPWQYYVLGNPMIILE